MKFRREIPLASLGLDGDPSVRRCDHPQCAEAGEFRAPKSRDDLGSYYWFCLDHVRAYNASWDYFRGMSAAEVERFQREAVIGHRPTWKLGEQHARAWARGQIDDSFGLFRGGGFEFRREPAPDEGKPMGAAHRKALAEMELTAAADLKEIKTRYKQLVKRWHPDVNGGDPQAAERFKAIAQAYSYLVSSGYH
jgi:hypothetical protein